MKNIKQVFTPGVVTDLNIGYNFSKHISASFVVNNIFNVLPKWKLEAVTNPDDAPGDQANNKAAAQALLNDPVQKNLLEGFLSFSGRYRILGYNGSQFSQLGTTFLAQLNFKF
jgi:iron complex outermembrane receptor protein